MPKGCARRAVPGSDSLPGHLRPGTAGPAGGYPAAQHRPELLPADHAADGLSHGLYLRIKAVMDRMGYDGEFSPGSVVSALRGRKTSAERWKRCAGLLLRPTASSAMPAASSGRRYQKDIYDFFRAYGCLPGKAFLGSRPVPGGFYRPHFLPWAQRPLPDRAARALVCIDFGVLQDDYCSDLQRSYYVLGGEAAPRMKCSGL